MRSLGKQQAGAEPGGRAVEIGLSARWHPKGEAETYTPHPARCHRRRRQPHREPRRRTAPRPPPAPPAAAGRHAGCRVGTPPPPARLPRDPPASVPRVPLGVPPAVSGGDPACDVPAGCWRAPGARRGFAPQLRPSLTFVPHDVGWGHPQNPALQGHIFSHQRLQAGRHRQDGRRLCAAGRETASVTPCSTGYGAIHPEGTPKPRELPPNTLHHRQSHPIARMPQGPSRQPRDSKVG